MRKGESEGGVQGSGPLKKQAFCSLYIISPVIEVGAIALVFYIVFPFMDIKHTKEHVVSTQWIQGRFLRLVNENRFVHIMQNFSFVELITKHLQFYKEVFSSLPNPFILLN